VAWSVLKAANLQGGVYPYTEGDWRQSAQFIEKPRLENVTLFCTVKKIGEKAGKAHF
jgi:hypothetical protein